MHNDHHLRPLGAAFAIAAVSLAGCSTAGTKVTQQWRDPTYARAPMRSVVVVAQNAPESTRRDVEDEFVDELEDEGIRAAAGHKVFGSTETDINTARAMARSRGFDAALIVMVRKTDSVTAALPQRNFYSAPFGSPNDSYNTPRLAAQYDVDVDTTLWDNRDDKTVWSGRARIENAGYGDFGARVSKRVVGELAKQNLLTP